jgi:hypothetical protein
LEIPSDHNAQYCISSALLVSLQPASAEPLLIDANAITVTFEQNLRFTARGSIDGSSNGWAIESFPSNQPDGTLDQSVVWPLVSPVAPPQQGRKLLLTFVLSCNSYEALQHTLGHFRLSSTLDSFPNLNSTFTPMTPFSMISSDPGTTFTLVNQDIVVGGANPNQAIYEVQVALSGFASAITPFRLDVFDPNGTSLSDVDGLPTGGPGRAPNGNFVLTHFSVTYSYVIPTPNPPAILERGFKP